VTNSASCGENLPWEKVEKRYTFSGPNGNETLADLFENRSQLMVYHFMFDPAWDAGCPHCSFWADNFDPIIVHLNHRDVTMLAISQAPYEKLAAYRKRMGWSFKWLSSGDSDFNRDYYVSFTPEEVSKKAGFYNYRRGNPLSTQREGVSAFYKDEDGNIFHTYSTYARGIDLVNTAYNYLTLPRKGATKVAGASIGFADTTNTIDRRGRTYQGPHLVQPTRRSPRLTLI
jgi:predicted dithiol-disulfide oxidoreductase (DUF899 family)